MVEYALGIALIALVSIGALSSLADSSGDRLEKRAVTIGTPVEDGVVVPTLPPPGPTVPGGPPGTVPVIQAAEVGALTGAASDDGNRWTATVQVSVRDASGNPIVGAVVQGMWTGASTQSGQCTTLASGGCTLTHVKIKDSQPNTVFTLSTITGDNVTYAAPALPPTVDILQP